MDEFKPNSFKSKQERTETVQEEEYTSLVSSKAKFKKRGALQRIADALIVEDPKTILINYAVRQIKRKLPSAVEDVVDIVLNPDEPRRGEKRSKSSKISYRDYWDYKDDEDYEYRKDSSSYTKSVLDFEEPIVGSRGEAEDVYETLKEIIRKKGEVSIATMYRLSGDEQPSHTYYKYGWKSLPEKANIVSVKEGFWIRLPRPVQIR